MPSNFLSARIRGAGTSDVTIGRMIGLKTFLPLGNAIVGVGLEDDTPTSHLYGANRIAQVGDRVFIWHRATIYLYDPTSGDWNSAYTVTNQDTGEQDARHGGLRFWQDLSGGEFGLVGVYRNNLAQLSALKYTYQTDTWAEFNSGGSTDTDVWNRTIQYRNAIYTWHTNIGARFFDPVTDTFGLATASPNGLARNTPFVIANNNLYLVCNNNFGVNVPGIYQLVGGQFLAIYTYSTPGDFTVDGNWFSAHGIAWYDASANEILTIYLEDPDINYRAIGVNLSTLVETDRSSILPSYLTTAGALGAESAYRLNTWARLTDQEDVLGSPQQYILWASGTGLTEAFNVYRYEGVGSQLTDLGASQLSQLFSVPQQNQGGSTWIYNDEDLWGCISGIAPSANGVDLTLTLTGDSVKVRHGAVAGGPFVRGETITGGTSGATGVVVEAWENELWLRNVSGTFDGDETVTGGTSAATATTDTLLSHGAVTGGPFQVGETVTGGTSGATATVTLVEDTFILVDTVVGGPFVNGEVLTGGTSGATATTNAAPTGQRGGVADKIGRLRFDIGEGIPNSQATLTAPAGGLTAPMTLNANDFETTLMDGREYVVKHETIGDGIPNAQPITYFLEFERT